MEVKNSTLNDVKNIFELYRIATDFMKSKNQVSWPEFPQELIESEIQNKMQWKIETDDQIACIWATTLSDELIWGEKNNTPSLYIHRIATNPNFRGQNLVGKIVAWADTFCRDNDLKFVRMDTVGLNEGLIKHYTKLGFDYIGSSTLKNTDGLPGHYKEGPVCLFQRAVNP